MKIFYSPNTYNKNIRLFLLFFYSITGYKLRINTNQKFTIFDFMNSCVKIIIEGRVQGVGFRYSAIDKANQYHITGYITNNPDYSITIVAEGIEEELDEFIVWCYNGPPRALVTKVNLTNIRPQNYSKFNIR